MPRERLRSNAQVRSAGVDPTLVLLVLGLVVSALVLLTMLGSSSDSRRSRRSAEASSATGRPVQSVSGSLT